MSQSTPPVWMCRPNNAAAECADTRLLHLCSGLTPHGMCRYRPRAVGGVAFTATCRGGSLDTVPDTSEGAILDQNAVDHLDMGGGSLGAVA